MSQNQNSSGQTGDNDVLHHSSGIRNTYGGGAQGGLGPYQRTPANYAGGPGPHANTQITLHAQNGQTKQTTTDAQGAISDQDRQWLADNGGALPISSIPPEDKAVVGTGTRAASQMNADASQVGTKPFDTRPPGSFNPNQQGGQQGGNQQGGQQGGNQQGGQQGGNQQGGQQGGNQQGGQQGGNQQGGQQAGLNQNTAYTKAELDNRANQLNPNNPRYGGHQERLLAQQEAAEAQMLHQQALATGLNNPMGQQLEQ
ncbi:unnamed protein product, partial [Didymodactylos carnosus]